MSGAARSVRLFWAALFLKSIFSSILSDRERSLVSTNARKSAILRRFVPAVLFIPLFSSFGDAPWEPPSNRSVQSSVDKPPLPMCSTKFNVLCVYYTWMLLPAQIQIVIALSGLWDLLFALLFALVGGAERHLDFGYGERTASLPLGTSGTHLFADLL